MSRPSSPTETICLPYRSQYSYAPEIDEKELDVWDGVNLGFYSKIKVRVQTLDGDALAWLYVLDAYEGGLPSAERLTILVDAALKAGAPADYIDWLRARPSNPPPSAPHA
jgi:AIG2-like family